MNFNNKLSAVLNELFDKQTQVNWSTQTEDSWYGTFVIGGKEYKISIIRDKFDNFYMPWEVVFCLKKDGKCTTDITGTGDAGQVFATVMSGVQEWMKSERPNEFVMSAAESSRQKLYLRMLQKYLPNGYEVSEADFRGDGFPAQFEITRAGQGINAFQNTVSDYL
jgi:hypothetical protein